jgi:hypothetical protein
MNTLEYWFKVKIANTMLEGLCCIIFLIGGAGLYVFADGNAIAQMLAKMAVVSSLVYFAVLFSYMHYSLQSLEIDAKPFERRTDSERQVQFYVAKVSTAKMLVALVSLLFLLTAVIYGL